MSYNKYANPQYVSYVLKVIETGEYFLSNKVFKPLPFLDLFYKDSFQ